MNRYHLIDTQTRAVVREQRTINGQINYIRRRKALLTPLDQDRLSWGLIGVIIRVVIP